MATSAVLGTVELLEHVLSSLSFYDLHKVQLVCHAWNNTIRHSLVLQRILFNEPTRKTHHDDRCYWGDFASKPCLVNPVLQRTLLIPRKDSIIDETVLETFDPAESAYPNGTYENLLETEPDPDVPVKLILKDEEDRSIWEYSWNVENDIPFEENKEYKRDTKWKKMLMCRPPLYEALVRPRDNSDESWVFREEEGIKMDQLLWSISYLDVLPRDEDGVLVAEEGTEMEFELLVPLQDRFKGGNAKALSGHYNLLRPWKTIIRVRIV
ncbi:hypothetical protein K431DRAFT_284695 [Polychaeton citri CBS 116435]|uniref:F-box domain-containing protein n=1 Tax=Polychaeton citri CBS 116435 TaxID=1314669 RepID=A0A9P4Q839_9PEZI|nr:hypothetical protein K431DRAFT_284695 [Polychaeton citri CBS 116435]